MSPKLNISPETVRILENGGYRNDGTPVRLNPHPPQGETIFLENISSPPSTEGLKAKMSMEVSNSDTISATQELREKLGEGVPIGVLHFASSQNPGGKYGDRGQGPSLCECSNLYSSIKDSEMYGKHRESPKRRNKGLYQHYAIYSENVTIFKTRDGESFKLLSQPIKANFVSSPAVNRKFAKHHHEKSQVDGTMFERMESIIQLFALKKQRNLILGAFGCGFFENSPEFVAKTFRKLLQTYESHFDHVVFAVPGESYRAFQKEFGEGISS